MSKQQSPIGTPELKRELENVCDNISSGWNSRSMASFWQHIERTRGCDSGPASVFSPKKRYLKENVNTEGSKEKVYGNQTFSDIEPLEPTPKKARLHVSEAESEDKENAPAHSQSLGFIWDPDHSGDTEFPCFTFDQQDEIAKRQVLDSSVNEIDKSEKNSGSDDQIALDVTESTQADDNIKTHSGLIESAGDQQSKSPENADTENMSVKINSSEYEKSEDTSVRNENPFRAMHVPSLFQASLKASLAAGILVENTPENEGHEQLTAKTTDATYIMTGINADCRVAEPPTTKVLGMSSNTQKSGDSDQQITRTLQASDVIPLNNNNSAQNMLEQHQYSEIQHQHPRPVPLSTIDENNNEMPSASTAEAAWNILNNLGHLMQTSQSSLPGYANPCSHNANIECSLPTSNFNSFATNTCTLISGPDTPIQTQSLAPNDAVLKAFHPPAPKPSHLQVQSMYAQMPCHTKYVGTPRPVELTSKGPKPLRVPQMIAGPYSYVHVPYNLQSSVSSMPPPPPRPLQPIQPAKSDVYQNVRQTLKFALPDQMDNGTSVSHCTPNLLPAMQNTVVDKGGSIGRDIGASPEFPGVPPNTPASNFKLRYHNILPGPMDQDFYTWSNDRDSRGDHNAKERKRRARISEACHALRQLVPGLSDKTDKATVFEFAAQYIIHLREVIGSEYDKDFLRKYSPY